MKNYLAVIFRSQFTLFYRFGYTFIPAEHLLEFNGGINESIKLKVADLFTSLPPFEYDEEYLLLHLERPGNKKGPFTIQNIVSVFPLSQQAKISIESKIDRRIRLSDPIFEPVLGKIEFAIQKQEIRKAIGALWMICELDDDNNKFISSIGIENIFRGVEYRKTGMKAGKIQDGNYWSLLLAYDRFDYFPNSILGYFYDAGQVFAYSKGLPTFEGSGLHASLQQLHADNPDIKFREIIAFLESEQQVKAYISQTTVHEIKQYVVAPLYLMLKEELRNSDELAQTKLVKNLPFLKEFGDNFKAAVVLLGAFFGYKKFYDAYYDRLNLRFYHSYNPELPARPFIDTGDEIITGSEPENEAERVGEPENKPEPVGKPENEPQPVGKPEIEPQPGSTASKKKPAKTRSESLVTEPVLAADLDKYKEIILSSLQKGELKLTDLVKEINSKSEGLKVNKAFVTEIIGEMKEDVELFKNKTMAKIKTPALFDTEE